MRFALASSLVMDQLYMSNKIIKPKEMQLNDFSICSSSKFEISEMKKGESNIVCLVVTNACTVKAFHICNDNA